MGRGLGETQRKVLDVLLKENRWMTHEEILVAAFGEREEKTNKYGGRYYRHDMEEASQKAVQRLRTRGLAMRQVFYEGDYHWDRVVRYCAKRPELDPPTHNQPTERGPEPRGYYSNPPRYDDLVEYLYKRLWKLEKENEELKKQLSGVPGSGRHLDE